MARVTDPRPPLPEWILECYDRLCTQACLPGQREDSVLLIDYDDAVDVLISDSELALEQRDVEHALHGSSNVATSTKSKTNFGLRRQRSSVNGSPKSGSVLDRSTHYADLEPLHFPRVSSTSHHSITGIVLK